MKMATILLTAYLIPLLQPFAARSGGTPATPERIAAPAGNSSCKRDVIWVDRARTQAWFFPSRCLEGIDLSSASPSDLSGLPINAREFLRLLARLRIEHDQTRLRGETPPCLRPTVSDGFQAPPLPGSQSLTDLALKADLAIVGQVVSATPGWSPIFYRPVTLIQVEVEDVLHDRRGSAAVGDLVTYLQESGSLDLDGLVLCTENKGFFEAAPGDRVFLNGDHFDGPHENHLNLREVFPIAGGKVVAQPYSHVKPAQLVSLSSVREEVASKAQKHE